MSVKTVRVPGEGSVELVVGDILFILFVEDCHPCFSRHEGRYFDRHLPHGNKCPGDSWGGVATEQGAGQTLHFWHTDPDGACVELEASRGRSITIGSGAP